MKEDEVRIAFEHFRRLYWLLAAQRGLGGRGRGEGDAPELPPDAAPGAAVAGCTTDLYLARRQRVGGCVGKLLKSLAWSSASTFATCSRCWCARTRSLSFE